jgi:pyruvate,water dikinase
MHFVRTLDDIQSADAPHVGGKAYHCAKLKQIGIPVPDGIVLTTEAMGRSLEIPQLQQWLSRLPDNILLAVRSSGIDEDAAGHSFAGIHQTVLNVSPGNVAEAVQSCWDSVASVQALVYRRAQGLDTKAPKTAVLIQLMIQSVVSGVAFTVNPVTGSNDELLINSAFGLGESIVGGTVDPDQFNVRKRDGRILSFRLAGNAASLTEVQLAELTRLLLKIESHFETAQDVEWCHDGRQFWIVQSRPVTTRPAAKDIEWTRANAREVFSDLPPPMTVYGVADAIEQAERKFYGKYLAPESELGRMIKVFYGRLYFNVDQIRHTCRLSGIAPANILRALGHEGDISPEDEKPLRPSLRELATIFPDLVRMATRQLTVGRKVRRQLVRTDQALKHFKSLNFRALADRDLWALNRVWRPKLIEDLQLVFVLASVSIYEKPLRDICNRVGISYERLAHTYLAAGVKSVSSEQGFDLLRVARIARQEAAARQYFSESRESFQDYRQQLQGTAFLSHFDEFLQRYGHRGRYESDVSSPRYTEDPSPLLFAIQLHVRSAEVPDPEHIISRQTSEAAKAWMEFESRLSWWQKAAVRPKAKWLLSRTRQLYVWRERVRSEIVRLAEPIRQLHLELAGRFVNRNWIQNVDDYFFLTLEDVDDVIDGAVSGESVAVIVSNRKSEWERLAGIEMPLLMRESKLSAIVRRFGEPTQESSTELRGLCVSAGYAEGRVIVMRDPAEFASMKKGAILVAPATDPSWTPLFTLAAGVIVEVGGVLSHASTVAREYGLPAVANVKHATRILKSGDRVILDATNGIIKML